MGGVEDKGKKWLPRERMQHLRERRAHPGTLTCCEHDDTQRHNGKTD
jgi:hypothetical protein